VLAPSPDHPLPGFRASQVAGCQGQALLPEQLCATCRAAYRRSGLGMEEFAAAGRCGPSAAAKPFAR